MVSGTCRVYDDEYDLKENKVERHLTEILRILRDSQKLTAHLPSPPLQCRPKNKRKMKASAF